MASKDESPLLDFLRAANLATFPFAFALSIASAAVGRDKLFPVIALVPQTASVLFSGAVLHFNKQRKAHQHVAFEDGNENRKRRIRNTVTFVGDVVLGASILTCLVFTWIHLSDGWYQYNRYWKFYTPQPTILGTYATVPFMINMTIHFFFAVRALYLSLPKEWLDAFRPAPSTCPNCHHNLGSRAAEPAPVNPAWMNNRSGVRYSLLNPEENDSLYRDIERQTGKAGLEDAERGEDARKASEETAREIAIGEVAKIVDA